MKQPAFLTLDEVLALHADQIHRYGGRPGVRDPALLASAVATPKATYGGGYLHPDLFEMAAAYLFHIVRNHPFIDGNKRSGLVAAIAFLGLNNLDLHANPDALFDLVTGVAEGHTSKSAVAVFLQQHSRRQRF